MSVILRLRRFAAIGAAMGFLSSPLATAKDRGIPGATVESVVALARQMSPELSSAALEADVAGHRIGAAGALPESDANAPGPVRKRAWDRAALDWRGPVIPGLWQARSGAWRQREAKDAKQRAASSKLDAARVRSVAIRIRLDGDIAEAWFGLEAVRKVIGIYERRQLPLARLLVEAARSGFQTGANGLAAISEAERRLRTVELELLRLKVEEQAKYEELERLAGGPL